MTDDKPLCPTCKNPVSPVRTLRTVDGGKRAWVAYVDPVDGATIHQCQVHGRVAVARDGRARLEARGKPADKNAAQQGPTKAVQGKRDDATHTNGGA